MFDFKLRQFLLLVTATMFFTAGGYGLHYTHYLMAMTAAPFVVGLLVVIVALNLDVYDTNLNGVNNHILRELNSREKYQVLGISSVSGSLVLFLKPTKGGSRIAMFDSMMYPPFGFKEEEFFGKWLIPENELSAKTKEELGVIFPFQPLG